MPPIKGSLRVVVECKVEEGGTSWGAYYMGNAAEGFPSREQALESLRRKIVGACYVASVVSVESVDLELAPVREVSES